MNLKEAEEKLKKKITDDYGQLKRHFREGGFKEMARILGSKTVLLSPEGRKISGLTALAEFWMSAKMSGKNDVDFKLMYCYLNEVKNIEEKKDPKRTILHTAHEITEFYLKTTEAGRTLTNCTCSWERALFHPRECVWEQ